MSQTFQLPASAGTDNAIQAISVLTPACLESLRSNFSGSSAPASPAPVTGQFWVDTASGYLKMRDAAGSAWITVAPLSGGITKMLALDTLVASLSATNTTKVGIADRAGTVKRLILLCETASTSSSGNEWQPMLKKYPNSAPGSPVNLFSGTVGTFTALGGVGGGVEFAANKALVFTPNQNATLADLDVLELVITKAGTATTLTNFRAIVTME